MFWEKFNNMVIHVGSVSADETPVQVLNEQNRKNTTKSFMWVYTNGEYEQLKKIRIYQYCVANYGPSSSPMGHLAAALNR